MDNCVKPTGGTYINIVTQGTTNCQNNTNVDTQKQNTNYANAAKKSGVTDPSVTARNISICDPEPEADDVESDPEPDVSTIYAQEQQVVPTPPVTTTIGSHGVSFDVMIEQAKKLVAVVSIDDSDSSPISGSAYPSCSYKPVKF